MALPQWLLTVLRHVHPTIKPVGMVISVPLPLATLPPAPEPPMNLGTFLAALQAINALLPEVVVLIQGIEKAFPDATLDAKLDAVVKTLQSFQALEAELAQPVSIVQGIVKSLTGAKPALAAA